MTTRERLNEHADHAVRLLKALRAETDPTLFPGGRVVMTPAESRRMHMLAVLIREHATHAATYAHRLRPDLRDHDQA